MNRRSRCPLGEHELAASSAPRSTSPPRCRIVHRLSAARLISISSSPNTGRTRRRADPRHCRAGRNRPRRPRSSLDVLGGSFAERDRGERHGMPDAREQGAVEKGRQMAAACRSGSAALGPPQVGSPSRARAVPRGSGSPVRGTARRPGSGRRRARSARTACPELVLQPQELLADRGLRLTEKARPPWTPTRVRGSREIRAAAVRPSRPMTSPPVRISECSARLQAPPAFGIGMAAKGIDLSPQTSAFR